MRLLITRYDLIRANEPIKCEACEIYWNWRKVHRDFYAGMKEIKIMMKCVEGLIPAGHQYVSYEFVDEDTGELFEMNVRNDLDAVMIERGIYPPLINRAIKLFNL